MTSKFPPPLAAAEVPVATTPSAYPEPFRSMMEGRTRHRLGDHFGLENFGVNLTRLAPGARSALRHAHLTQDEFVYILQGRPTLYGNDGPVPLAPGMCAGFRAGTGNAANLVNETDDEVIFLEIGDRSPGDQANYPDDDLQAHLVDGTWRFSHKDGTPWD